jgi:hypothetical protein
MVHDDMTLSRALLSMVSYWASVVLLLACLRAFLKEDGETRRIAFIKGLLGWGSLLSWVPPMYLLAKVLGVVGFLLDGARNALRFLASGVRTKSVVS